MTRSPQLSARDRRQIGLLVQHFRGNRTTFESLLEQLVSSFRSDEELAGHIHSLRWRVKDCSHLQGKLERKTIEAKAQKRPLEINPQNLFEKINDLAGCRILHLYTKQFELIHECLTRIFDEYKYELVEGPTARTWDDESQY
jgi:putative GTP pyrophosphokinase